jgi:trigger factor
VDEQGNDIENGIKKDNSLLLKYFSPTVRTQWMGKKTGESLVLKLEDAFEEKEREWITGDLGLENQAGATEKYFRIALTKIGLLEKRELNEEFFNQLYPGSELKSVEDFRAKLRGEIENYWNAQARNQVHDQVFHELVDHTRINFPEDFLKKWLKTQKESKSEAGKTDEQVEQEFPSFISQLKWTLISDKIIRENDIQVQSSEIRDFARQQLFSYMGNNQLSDEQPWVNDYVERMMKDRKYVDDAYNRIQTRKIFEWADTKVHPEEKDISADEFAKIMEAHQHHHH